MRIKIKNFGILNGKDLCLYILGLFILDSIFHITGYFLGGSRLGRIALLGLMLIISCTGIIRQKICKLNRNDIAVIVLSALLCIGFLRAVISGQDINFVKPYILNGFIYLLYLPIMYYCLDSVKKCEILLQYSTIIGFVISLFAISLAISYILFPPLLSTILNFLYRMNMVLLISGLGKVARVMLKGIVLQVLGIFGGFYFFVKGENKLFWLGVSFINLLGIAITYSRGIIGGVILALAFWIILSSKFSGIEKGKAKILNLIGFIVLLFVLLYMLCGEHGHFFSYIIERFTGTSNDGTLNSDVFRKMMNKMIHYKILEAPFWGGGLGEHINLRDGAIEMTYQDIVIRIGFVGLSFFLYPVLSMLVKLLRENSNITLRGVIFLSLIAIMFAAYFNPYLITSLGLFVYCFCIRAFSLHTNKA